MKQSQTVPLGKHQVPAIWARYFDEDFFYLKVPDEREATCDRCPGVLRHGFKEPYRCCTYVPHLANYKLGAALADPSTRDVASRVLGFYALPEGVIISPAHHRDALESNSLGEYGKNPKRQCPFLIPSSGQCGIYSYRNSVCSTYFCWNDHGVRGQMFWEKVQSLVSHSEMIIAQWCMRQLGCSVENYMEILARHARIMDTCSDPRTGGWHKAIIDELFGFWQGSAEEYFMACHDLVQQKDLDLADLIKREPLMESQVFNRAFYEWLNTAQKAEYGEPPHSGDVIVRPVESLMYEVKLFHRHLWDLPFGAGAHVLSPRVSMTYNLKESEVDRFFGERPYRLVMAEKSSPSSAQFDLYLSKQEFDALSSFVQPEVVTAASLKRLEMLGIKDPRKRLAEWLRLLILVPVESEATFLPNQFQ